MKILQPVEVLLDRLDHPSVEMRRQAAKDLGLTGDIRAVEPLVAALDDVDPMVRQLASNSLGQLGDARAVPAILRAIETTSQYPLVVGLLAFDLDRNAVGPLTRALDAAIAERRRQEESCPDRDMLDRVHRDPRGPIELAFTRIRDPEACGPLLALIEEPLYRQAALNGFAGIGRPSIAPLLDVLARSKPPIKVSLERALCRLADAEALDSLIEASGKAAAVKALTAELGWTDLQGSRPVIDWVRSIGWPIAERFLGELDHPDNAVRVATIKLLGDIGDRRATLWLIPFIRNSEYQVRMAALTGLRMLADPASIEPLVGALDLEESDPVRFALVAVGKPAVPSLIAAVADDRAVVRRNAIRALGSLRDERAFDILLASVGDPDLDVPREAIRGLKALQDARAVPRLTRVLYYRDLWREAAEALLAIGTPEAIDGIREAIEAAEESMFRHQLQRLLDDHLLAQAKT